ncbi:MAG: SDR family oxidoreductase [Rhodospirillales bacterium]|nr:SDR family oxidoreductase [Rhodospirillales bacterium]
MKFSGKSVVVTGGAAGIGAATVIAFAKAGGNVLAVDRDAKALDGLKAPTGGRIDRFVADIGTPEACDGVIAEALRRAGRIDVLVNNAGILFRKGFLETTDDEWRQTMAINANAPFFLARAAARAMRTSGGGAIVNVASELGLFAIKGAFAYSASKAAVIQMTRALALDFAEFKIRVNAVAPGRIHTGMLEAAIIARGGEIQQGVANAARMVPMGRVGQPEEIAQAILFLASDDASYVTGTTLSADGGDQASGPAGVPQTAAPVRAAGDLS